MTVVVSVVVPTHNRAHELRECLLGLAAQSLSAEQFEVIVVDDGSSDDTLQVVESVRCNSSVKLRYVFQSILGPSAARNLGIEMAQAELIAFTDDDCRANPCWLERLLHALPEDPKVAGVGGETIRVRENVIGRYIDAIGTLSHGVKDGIVIYLVTAKALFRRSCLQSIGGFERRIDWPGGEDVDLSFRLLEQGYRLEVTNRAVIRHKHRDTLGGLYRTFVRYGRGEAQQVLLGRRGGFFHSFTFIFVFCCLGHFVVESVKLVFRPGILLGDRLRFPFLRLVTNLGIAMGYASHRLRNN